MIPNLITTIGHDRYSELKDQESLNSSTIYIVEKDGNVEGISLGDKAFQGSFAPEPPYEAVDLGLPSGVKWANMNVGATKSEEYGDYFMWGSTTPDTDKSCDWANCPFNNGSSSFDGTYFDSVKDTVCPNGILAPEYDAATQIMGGSWRMPTNAEIQELLVGTRQTRETLNGVKGMRFTSMFNANSIFMPFAGTRVGSEVYDVGNYGCAWSSSLRVGKSDNSYYLYFYSGANVSDCYRYLGLAVRGVC